MYTVPKLDDYSPQSLDGACQLLTKDLESAAKQVTNENEWKNFRDAWLGRKTGVANSTNGLLA